MSDSSGDLEFEEEEDQVKMKRDDDDDDKLAKAEALLKEKDEKDPEAKLWSKCSPILKHCFLDAGVVEVYWDELSQVHLIPLLAWLWWQAMMGYI